jgi:hypothetical protein
MRYVVSKKVCWLMIFVLLFTFSGFPDLALAQTPSQSRSAELKQVADRLEKMFKALRQAEREIPRDTFDPKVIVAKVGKDPVKLFEWVRDNTYLVPYRGVLRGPKGVLMDRLGNSLDRALLLNDLLFEAGHKVTRLAHARLLKEKAGELLERARPIPKEGTMPTTQPSRQTIDGLVQKYARQYDLDAAQLRKVINNMTVEQDRLAKEAVRRTEEQTAAIAAAVEPFRESNVPDPMLVAAEALQGHWWVQFKTGSKWIDLDPSLPDMTPGHNLADAKETFQGDKLHNRLFDEVHKLQIRVVIERWEKGRLVELPVLTQVLWPFQLIGERVAIHHAPMKWPDDFNLLNEENPLARFKGTVLAQREWVPVLSVGPNRVAKLSFTDSGRINDPSLPGSVQNVLAGREFARGFQEGTEQLGTRIERMLRGEEPRRSAKETNERLKVNKPKGRAQLSAEWIEYEIRVPGEKPRKIRRQIFDLLGPAARAEGKGKNNVSPPNFTDAQRLDRGLALLGQTEILPVVGQLSPDFVEHLAAENLLSNKTALLGMFRNADTADFKALTDQATKLTRLPVQLYSLALARVEWSRPRGAVYLDHLNILSFHTRPRQNAQLELMLFRGFDIVANDVAVRSGSGIDPFLIRLAQGVQDTNTEALLAAADCRRAENIAACATPQNTAMLFAISRAQGNGWLTIQNIGDPTWQSIDLPRDVRSHIEQDLTNGYVVMIPNKTVDIDGQPYGWWRVQPRTGQTLGIDETGWGQGTTEYTLTLSQMVLRVSIPLLMLTALCVATVAVVEEGIPKKPVKTSVGCFFVAVTLLVGLFITPLEFTGIGLIGALSGAAGGGIGLSE